MVKTMQLYLQDKVDATAKGNRQGAVDPEQNVHSIEQPFASLADRRAVLGDVDKNRSETDKPCWNEKTLRWVRDRCCEGGWIEVESKGYHYNVEDEEYDVEEEHGASDCVEPGKFVWHCRM